MASSFIAKVGGLIARRGRDECMFSLPSGQCDYISLPLRSLDIQTNQFNWKKPVKVVSHWTVDLGTGIKIQILLIPSRQSDCSAPVLNSSLVEMRKMCGLQRRRDYVCVVV